MEERLRDSLLDSLSFEDTGFRESTLDWFRHRRDVLITTYDYPYPRCSNLDSITAVDLPHPGKMIHIMASKAYASATDTHSWRHCVQ